MHLLLYIHTYVSGAHSLKPNDISWPALSLCLISLIYLSAFYLDHCGQEPPSLLSSLPSTVLGLETHIILCGFWGSELILPCLYRKHSHPMNQLWLRHLYSLHPLIIIEQKYWEALEFTQVIQVGININVSQVILNQCKSFAGDWPYFCHCGTGMLTFDDVLCL